MSQWKKLLGSLSLKQRAMIGAAAVLIAAGIFSFTRWRHDESFTPLFTAMYAEDAGAVIQKLKENGIEYRITEQNGTTILVPAANVAEIRIQMASAGLPRTGRAGFEIFDRTNLGTTDFAEHINYARAVEGELERSIRCLREIDQARVHLTFPKDSVFVESRQPAKASVLLSLKAGARISPQNVVAITHLVASAVEGLSPDAISVVDMRGTLLSKPKRNGGENDGPVEAGEYRETLERDLVSKINRTLEPLLGADKFRASVAAECDLTSAEESHETYDPEKTVMLNTTRTEENSGSSTAGGVPGTASALPRPVAKIGGANSLVRKSETVAYQPSKTVRHVRIPVGSLKRISVALLIDHSLRWEDRAGKQTRVIVPPSPETLKSIREMVAAAIGFNAERGDQLVVEALPFESTLYSEPPPAITPPQPNRLTNVMPFNLSNPRLQIGIGAGALIVLLAASVVFVKRRKARSKKVVVAADPQLEGSTAREMAAQLKDQTQLKRQQLADVQASLKLGPVQTHKGEVLVQHLRESISSDPHAAVGVIRNWMRED
jgi:flagellar M-ring protein FliF